jgi:hypothetical protein
MDEKTTRKPIPAPAGNIEPHAQLLNIPPDDQLLYKVMTIENLLSSIAGSYLHFNRVDSYVESPAADLHDGQQLPQDLRGNINQVPQSPRVLCSGLLQSITSKDLRLLLFAGEFRYYMEQLCERYQERKGLYCFPFWKTARYPQ